jgi:hypothetical protein
MSSERKTGAVRVVPLTASRPPLGLSHDHLTAHKLKWPRYGKITAITATPAAFMENKYRLYSLEMGAGLRLSRLSLKLQKNKQRNQPPARARTAGSLLLLVCLYAVCRKGGAHG